MHPERLLWLLWPLLLGFAAVYLATFRLLVVSTRRGVAPRPDLTAIRHGHLVLLRPSSAPEPPVAVIAGRSRLERRRTRTF